MYRAKGSALDQEKPTVSCQAAVDLILFFRKSISAADASHGGSPTLALAPGQENGSKMAPQPVEIA
jgi:hypothetical protein